MKKTLLSIALAGSLFASEASDKVIDFVKSLVPQNYEVKLVKVEKIPDSNYESVEFNILENGEIRGSDVFYTDGKFGSPTLFDLKNKKDLKADFIGKKEAEKQSELAKKLPSFIEKHKDLTIKLGNKKSNTYTVVFSDPECPWCRKHLDSIEDELKESNILFVLSPLPMHPNAADKSINILKEIKKAKQDSEKIKILRKYYEENAEFSKASDKEKEELSKKVEEVFKLGVNYTPAIFKDVKIK